MRRLSLGVLLIGILLTARPALSQSAGDLELNVFFGGSWHSSNAYEVGPPQSVTPIQQEFTFNQGYRGGVRVNVANSGHWGEEFVYSFESNEARFITVNPSAADLELGMQVHQFAINTLYYIDADESLPVRPFLSFGIGGTLYRPTDEAKAIARDPLRGNLGGIDNSSELAFNYGIGLKAKISDRIGFRVDGKGFISRTPSFGFARESTDPNATVFAAGGAFHNAEASAGLIFYLD